MTIDPFRCTVLYICSSFSVCLCIHLCSFICPSIYLSIYLSLFVYQSMYLPVCLSIYLFTCLSIYLSISIYLFTGTDIAGDLGHLYSFLHQIKSLKVVPPPQPSSVTRMAFEITPFKSLEILKV